MTSTARSFLPHAISLARPAIGVCLLVFIDPRAASALPLVLVAAAAATDWIDGQVARRFRAQTQAGHLVDNFCDFSFLLCAFLFLARGDVWMAEAVAPPLANYLPAFALLASFGVYFVRLSVEIAAKREPGRTKWGHAAGVANYALAILGAAELSVQLQFGAWPLRAAALGVAILNVRSLPENLALLFHRQGDGPTMAG